MELTKGDTIQHVVSHELYQILEVDTENNVCSTRDVKYGLFCDISFDDIANYYMLHSLAKLPQNTPLTCDCGAKKAKTTHSSWCSVKS